MARRLRPPPHPQQPHPPHPQQHGLKIFVGLEKEIFFKAHRQQQHRQQQHRQQQQQHLKNYIVV
jgi:hypothetical protein